MTDSDETAAPYRPGSYLCFVEVPTSKKTGHWSVVSTSGTRLGAVKFWPAWRSFVFEPHDSTVFNEGCLTDLAAFCNEQTAAWRRELTER